MLSIAIFVCQCHQPNTDLVTKNGESEELQLLCVMSSDALVHLQVSTEYLSKSCRTVWLDALPSKQKLAVEVKVQQTAMPARRVKMHHEYLMR